MDITQASTLNFEQPTELQSASYLADVNISESLEQKKKTIWENGETKLSLRI